MGMLQVRRAETFVGWLTAGVLVEQPLSKIHAL